MLWFLRKAFGIITLAWIVGWLLAMVSCVVDPGPKGAGAALGALMIFGNVVGIPAGIIWAVLKVISVLSAPRRERLAALVAYPPRSGVLRSDTPLPVRETPRVPPSGILRLETPAPVGKAPRTETANSASTAGPEQYTYSAPGMAMCPECGSNPVIFYCSPHNCGVCLECVAKHDNPQECMYIPAFRAPKPTAEPDATSPAFLPLTRAKPGDVFGIS